ncbi:MAG: SGNH/GDSL hydrolase family protein [Actinomycetota bacterium]
MAIPLVGGLVMLMASALAALVMISPADAATQSAYVQTTRTIECGRDDRAIECYAIDSAYADDGIDTARIVTEHTPGACDGIYTYIRTRSHVEVGPGCRATFAVSQEVLAHNGTVNTRDVGCDAGASSFVSCATGVNNIESVTLLRTNDGRNCVDRWSWADTYIDVETGCGGTFRVTYHTGLGSLDRTAPGAIEAGTPRPYGVAVERCENPSSTEYHNCDPGIATEHAFTGARSLSSNGRCGSWKIRGSEIRVNGGCSISVELLYRPMAVPASNPGPTPCDGRRSSTCLDPDLVTLGDSYASGEGLYVGALDVACGRYRSTYGDLLATHGYDHFKHACSGSTTDDLRYGAQVKNAAGFLISQIQALKIRDELSVVTLSIGGNDMGFADVLSCMVRKETQGACDGELQAEFDRLAGSAGDNGVLYDTYRQVLDNMPTLAKLYVFNYPAIFEPTFGNPGDGGLPTPACEGMDAHPNVSWWKGVDPDEAVTADRWGGRLNDAIRDAVTAVDNTSGYGGRIEYVDVAAEFEGHGLCRVDDYLNDMIMLPCCPLRPDESSFHPTALGHSVYFNALWEAMHGTRRNDGPKLPPITTLDRSVVELEHAGGGVSRLWVQNGTLYNATIRSDQDACLALADGRVNRYLVSEAQAEGWRIDWGINERRCSEDPP